MHDVAKYLPSPSMKGGGFEASDWSVSNKYIKEDVIQVATKEGLPASMQDKLGDNHDDYCYITHEE